MNRVGDIAEKKGITLAEYVANLQTDKQQYSEADTATDDYLDATPEDSNEPIDSEPESDTVDVVKTMGNKFLAETFCAIYGLTFNKATLLLSQGYFDTKKNGCEMTDEDLAVIERPLRAYLDTVQMNMSPAGLLFTTVLGVSIPKLVTTVFLKKQAIKELKQSNEQQDSNE